jgi:Ca-activated chloride channel family protein
MSKIFVIVISLISIICSSFLYAEQQIKLDTALSTPVLLAKKKQNVYLKVSLTGLPLKGEPAPINLALVIDTSGSMQGEKIDKAKESISQIIKRLRSQDIISIITFNDQAKILLSATKASDQDMIIQKINNLKAGGSTALYDGVKQGAKEIRKFFNRRRVNRIILLSDGHANVGLKEPKEIGELGALLKNENISVTTFGFGEDYNEDLLVELADKSDGNHWYINYISNLINILEIEFNNMFSVTSQEVDTSITFGHGIRPLRVLNRDAKIRRQQVFVKLNQLYSKQEKYILLELEVPANKVGKNPIIYAVDVNYRRMDNNKIEHITSLGRASFTSSVEKVANSKNTNVMIAVAEQLSIEQNELAVKFRDEGKIKEAQRVLRKNAKKLKEAAVKYKSKDLQKLQKKNLEYSKNLEKNKNWNQQRKLMREYQHNLKNQQYNPRSHDLLRIQPYERKL